MFKLAKYYILINLYQKKRRNIIAIIISIFLMVVATYIFHDFIEITDGTTRYSLIAAKWILIVLLLSIVVLNILKLLKSMTRPFKKDHSDGVNDTRRERILDKEHLISKSELIINKYRSN